MSIRADTRSKEVGANRRGVWRIAMLVLLYLGATALQFCFEHSEQLNHYFMTPRWIEGPLDWAGRNFNSPFAYIPRPTEARYVALVGISDGSEGPLHGPCEVREFLAKLLPAIVAARPSMVVLDVALAGDDEYDACPPEDPRTRTLVQALENAAKSTPLVIGRASLKLEDMPEERAGRLRDNGFRENDLLLRTPIQLESEEQTVAFGLVWPNEQLERVPINWPAHEADTSGAISYPSIGFVAAKIYRSTFPNGDERLNELGKQDYHPITQLLSMEAFANIPASLFLCDPTHPETSLRQCTVLQVKEASNKLRGRIVVVGFNDRSDDQWITSAGRMPGFVLQANYIESLLDARAFRPLSFGVTCLLSMLWLLLVEMPYWLFELPIWRRVSISVGVSLIVVFLARYVALVNFGLFVNLFTPSVFLVSVSILHVMAKRFEE